MWSSEKIHVLIAVSSISSSPHLVFCLFSLHISCFCSFLYPLSSSVSLYPFFILALSLPHVRPVLYCCSIIIFIISGRRWRGRRGEKRFSRAATDGRQEEWEWGERDRERRMKRRRGVWRHIAHCAIWVTLDAALPWRHDDWFLWLLQHGIQLVSQVIEHAADVVEDANSGLLLSHRAKTHTHRSTLYQDQQWNVKASSTSTENAEQKQNKAEADRIDWSNTDFDKRGFCLSSWSGQT